MAVEVHDGITIINGLICEEVRPEPNGKWALLGVFSGDIVVPEVPAFVRMAVYFEAQLTKPYEGKMLVRFRLDDAQSLLVVGSVVATAVGPMNFPVPAVMVPFQQAGIIHIDMGI